MALCDPETVRNGGQTSYSRLKTSVRLFFDQKMRSRNLKAPKKKIHGGEVTRSREDNKANVERKVGDCWQWQATGQCCKGETRVVSIMELELLVSGANFINKKSGRPRLH